MSDLDLMVKTVDSLFKLLVTKTSLNSKSSKKYTLTEVKLSVSQSLISFSFYL